MNNPRVDKTDVGGRRLAIAGPLIIGFVFLMWMAFTSAVDAEDLAVENAALRVEVSYLRAELATVADRDIASVTDGRDD